MNHNPTANPLVKCGWCKRPIVPGQEFRKDSVYGSVHINSSDCFKQLKGEIKIGEPDIEGEIDDERYKMDIELEERKIRALENIAIQLENFSILGKELIKSVIQNLMKGKI
jgi:hypothetical protein